MHRVHPADRHSRVLETPSRLSTAQRSIASFNPVSVSFTQPKMDPDELRRVGARILNMQHLINQVFDGSLAALALHTEMAPDRLKSIMEMHVPFSSEIAEHLEKCLNLPGGWLDIKRTSIDAAQLKSIIFAPQVTETAANSAAAANEQAAENPDSAKANENAGAGANPSHIIHDFSDSSFGEEPVASSNAQTHFQQAQKRDDDPAAVSAAVILAASQRDHDAHPDAVASDGPTDAASTHGDSASTQQERNEMETRTDTTENTSAAQTPKQEPKRLNDPVTQTLIWLNHELDRFRSSKGGPVRPEIAEIMGRAPSTLSTWLTGVRKMPEEMLVPLVLAIEKINLPVAPEFRERMKQVAPAAMRHLPPAPHAPAAAAVAPSSAAVAEKVSAGVPDSAEKRNQDKGEDRSLASATHAVASSLPANSEIASNQELKLTIARAADRVASVLQKLMEN